MTEKHLSSQFDAELNAVFTHVLEMGGVVESQLQQTISALTHFSAETCDLVLTIEDRINHQEVQIDHRVTSIMSRRQPTARDLRLLVGVSRIIINLERAGDEISIIAKRLKAVIEDGLPRNIPITELRVMAGLAAELLHRALDGFARLDVEGSLSVLNCYGDFDNDHAGLARKLLTFMMEDPRLIGAGLNLMFLARAIERVGAHATNISEATIYIVKGADLRHSTAEQRNSIIE